MKPRDYKPASPVTLARWYLAEFGEQFGLAASPALAEPATAAALAESGLELADVKPVRDDATVVAFAQIHAGLPVFEAGLSVKVRSDLSAIISAQSTLHLDISLDKVPPATTSEDAPNFSEAQLTEALGPGSGNKRLEIETARLVIYR